jgi:hypothetical protein
MIMSVAFDPQILDFGAVAAGSAGPAYDPDVFAHPPPLPPGSVTCTGCPAGNITASIIGDTTHFKIGVFAYKVLVVRGIHYVEVGSSDGVTKLPVSQGQVVSVQVGYDAKSATGTVNATLVIHGDNPAWGADSLIPLTFSVIPVRTIETAFGSPVVTIAPGGAR